MADFILDYDMNERARALGLDIAPASGVAGFGAAFEETIVRNPTASIVRDADRANYYERTYIDEFGQEHTIPAKPARQLTAEEANAKYGVGKELVFEADTPEPVAQQLHVLKMDEIWRQETLRRADAGWGTQLVAGLMGSLVDPLNVASAFIPVVGEARFLKIAGAIGVPAARTVRGVLEGGAGAALLEPFVYSTAQTEQADYSMADSMINILFGSALGGGLHLGVGYMADRAAGRRTGSPLQREIDSLRPEAQADMLRAAEAQVLEGNPVDVSPVADVVMPSRVMDRIAELEMQPGETRVEFEARQALIREVDPEAVDAIASIKEEIDQLDYWVGAYQTAMKTETPLSKAAERVTELKAALQEPNLSWKAQRDLQTELDLLVDEFSAPSIDKAIGEFKDRSVKSAKVAKRIRQRIGHLQSKLPDLNRRVSDAFRVAQQQLVRGPEGQKIAQRMSDTTKPVMDAQDTLAAQAAQQRAEKVQGPPKSLQEDIADIEAELNEYGQYIPEDEYMTAELKETLAEADLHEKAYRTAAACRMEKSA